jgi:hypothetical protein
VPHNSPRLVFGHTLREAALSTRLASPEGHETLSRIETNESATAARERERTEAKAWLPALAIRCLECTCRSLLAVRLTREREHRRGAIRRQRGRAISSAGLKSTSPTTQAALRRRSGRGFSDKEYVRLGSSLCRFRLQALASRALVHMKRSSASRAKSWPQFPNLF